MALRPEGPVTSGDLACRAAGIAAALTADGAGGRARVLAIEDRAELLAALVACSLVGDVAVLPGMMAPGALWRLAEQTGSVLSDRPADDDRALSLAAVPSVAGTDPASHTMPPLTAALARLSTSGSTGSPKAIDKTTGQLLGEARALAGAWQAPHAPVLATVPAQHIYGLLFGVLVPLVRGVPFVADTPRLPGAVARRVHETGARTLVTVPAQLRALADPALTALSDLALVTTSGAPLPSPEARAWHAAFGTDPVEVYGSTETGGIAWRQQRRDPAWRPLPGVSWHVDADGRLHVAAPWLAPRTPRPWRTDDLATAQGAGFVLRGRADDVVKIASKRVSVREVETVLRDAPGVTDAAVLARPDPARGTRLEALVAPAGCDLAVVRAHLATRFEPIALPRLVAVPALPRTAAGKLPRAAVADALDRATGRALAIDDLDARADHAEATVRVPARGPWFDGHLPGHPLLPGVGALDGIVGRAARAAFPGLGALVGARRVRFLQPIRPGATLHLTLDRSDHTVTFRLRDGDTACASGQVVFARGA